MAHMSQLVSVVAAMALGFMLGVLFQKRRDRSAILVALAAQKFWADQALSTERTPISAGKFEVYDTIKADQEAEAKPKDAPVLPTVKL